MAVAKSPNTISIRIDIRSSLSFLLLSLIASTVTILLVIRINSAVEEIDNLRNADIYTDLGKETANPSQSSTSPR